jgi:hypothetical protein
MTCACVMLKLSWYDNIPPPQCTVADHMTGKHDGCTDTCPSKNAVYPECAPVTADEQGLITSHEKLPCSMLKKKLQSVGLKMSGKRRCAP